MRKISPEEMKSAFDKIPSETMDAIASVPTNKILQELSKKYNLHVDKVGTLDGLISLEIVGLISPSEFPDVIIEELGIPKETMIGLVSDINEQIFKAIRQKIQQKEELQKQIEAEEKEEREAEPRPMIVINTDAPILNQNQDAILKNSGISLEEPRESIIKQAIDTSQAGSLDRDSLIKNIENPPANRVVQPAPMGGSAVGAETARNMPNLSTIPEIKEPAPIPEPEKPQINANPMIASVPTPNPVSSIISDKLQATFKLPKQESNYSMPKMNDSKMDPYKEPIETT